MNEPEAQGLLEARLLEYRRCGYDALLRLLEQQDVFEAVGASGTTYQLEVQAVWDDRKAGNLRVIVSIDDGGWRAFMPLASSFIMRPNGTFVDE